MWKPYEVPSMLTVSQLYSFFTHRYPQGYSFPGEIHDFWECVYVRRGSLRAVGGEETYALSGGELVVHQPMELHRFDVVDEEGAELLIFSFALQGAAADFFRRKVFYLSGEQQRAIEGMLQDAPVVPPEADPADTRAAGAGLQCPATTLQRMAANITVLLLLLYEQPCAVPSVEGADARVFRNISRYMQQNLGRNLPLPELSREFFISQTGIKRIFKRYTGIGVHAYFLKLKLTEAAKLLQDGRSVGETAMALGFCDPGYFSVIFKKETGYSPGEYKRRHNG